MAGIGIRGRPGPAPDPLKQAFFANSHMLAWVFAFSGAISILTLTSSFYMIQVYDRVLTSRHEETLFLLTLIAVVALLVMGALDTIRLRMLVRVGIRIGDTLAARVLRAMVATNSQTGSMSARSGLRDIDAIRNFVGSQNFATLIDMPFGVILMVVLYFMHPFYLYIVLGGGALLAAIAMLNNRATSKLTAESIGKGMQAHNFAEDGLRNADVLEGMGMSSTFVDRWRKQWIESLRLSTKCKSRSNNPSLKRPIGLAAPEQNCGS